MIKVRKILQIHRRHKAVAHYPLENLIFIIRNQKVVIDGDLARLYGVTTKRLNEQVRRNQSRFPQDFMFALTLREKEELVANCDRFENLKHSSASPNVFTEHGVIMAASVLNSKYAIDVSVYIVRAFVKLREFLSTHKDLIQKFRALENKMDMHDQAIVHLMTTIRRLISDKNKKKKTNIGFLVDKEL